MRRRRKFRGTWMPNIGTVQEDPTQAPTAGIDLDISIAGGAGGIVPVVAVTPLILDQPQEPDPFISDLPLSYFTANEYALRRIVGKCFVQTYGFTSTTSEVNLEANAPLVQVTAGFFVARAGDEQSTPDGALRPIGWSTQYLLSYNPDIPDTIREPWIWRRQWLIGNFPTVQMLWQNLTFNTLTVEPGLAWDVPTNNWVGRSVADGPHIDARTRRRVGNDDRLWFAAVAQNYPRRTSGGYDSPSVVRMHLDYRVFGAMRKARNRGAF